MIERPGGYVISAARAMGQEAIQPYDFRQSLLFPAESMEAATRRYRRVARTLQQQLRSNGAGGAEVELAALLQQPLSEFAERLPMPSSVVYVSLAPQPGEGVLQFDAALGFGLVTALLGGRRAYAPPPRPLTRMEYEVLGDLLEGVLASFSQSWKDDVPLCLTPRAAMDDLDASRLGDADTPLLIAHFFVDLGETSGAMRLVLPTSALQPKPEVEVLPGFARAAESPLLAELGVMCQARTRPVSLTLAELSDLHEGDVLLLQPAAETAVEITAGGACRFDGRLTAEGDHLAIAIVEEYVAPEAAS